MNLKVITAYLAVLCLILLSSCKIDHLHSANGLSKIKRGMDLSYIDSLYNLGGVDEHNPRLRKAKEIIYVDFEGKQLKFVIVKITNLLTTTSSTKQNTYMDYSRGASSNPRMVTESTPTYKTVHNNDNIYLLFDNDKFVNCYYLYEFLNSPNPRDNKLGEAIALITRKIKFEESR